MTAATKKRHIAAIKAVITANNFTIDRWGNWKNDQLAFTYRIKLMTRNIRIEKKIGTTWFKLTSQPIINLTITDLEKFMSRFTRPSELEYIA